MSEDSVTVHSPLLERHKSQGAKTIEVFGWEVVESFTSPVAEYNAMNKMAALFDMCHRSRFKVTGPSKDQAVNFVCSYDLTSQELNTEQTGLILNERGCIVDMVRIFRTDKAITIHGSPYARSMVYQALSESAMELGDVDISDLQDSQVCFEIRGIEARRILQSAVIDGSIPEEGDRTSVIEIGQARCLVSTQKLGGEVESFRLDTGTMFAQSVWDRMNTIGVKMGLALGGYEAAEMVRLESGIPYVGKEINERVTPFEAGCDEYIDLTRNEFIGRKAFLHSSMSEFSKRLVMLKLDDARIPPEQGTIELGGIPVGYITSSCYSPSYESGIAMGFVDSIKSSIGTVVEMRDEKNDIIQGSVIQFNSLGAPSA